MQEGGQRTSWPRHRLLSSSSFSHAMPPDHPVLVSMAKRKSVFYRRPKPPSPQPPADQTPEDAAEQESSDIGSDGDCSCASPAAHDTGYEPGSDASDESEEEMYTTAAYLDTDTEFLPSYDSQLSYQLCQQLPFFSCHFAQDTQSFIPTQSPAHLVRPCTVKEQPTVYEMDEREFYPPTLEIVDSIIEYLNLIYRVDTCAAIIPMGRRLPELHEFIWRLMDGTMVDLWTAIACAILLRRIYRSRSYSEEAPYEAAHSLFLGVFMLSSISCVNTSRPEVLGAAGIVRILDSWYETHDLVRIKRETLVLLNYRTWISLPDILAYGKNNIFDIYRINSSYTFFKKRQEQRMRLEEENQKRIARRKSLVARLERFMHRTPHDSLGSWNTETMYCTESRFLFRHLPWFPGSINPVHVTARSENINLYYNSWNKKYLPVFSPLLPPTRTRVSSTTN
ncbi:hypothetical protein GGI26_005438 [Coemansia sp. RSA 1358]|nr:hypothetical protein BX070DRAFT_224628 [Coemansia spiralis]KAJ2619903.1 hypothetical protein GGI26_005438 [Coemansia sp. RSA 1358]